MSRPSERTLMALKMESHFSWYHFDGQNIASKKHAEENTKDKEKNERIVILKGFI